MACLLDFVLIFILYLICYSLVFFSLMEACPGLAEAATHAHT